MKGIQRSNSKCDVTTGDAVEILIKDVRAWLNLRQKVGQLYDPAPPFPISNTECEGRLSQGNRFTVCDVATHVAGSQTFIAARVDLREKDEADIAEAAAGGSL